MLISFEGGEGAGKSTLIKKIYDHLVEQNKSVLLTRAPGGTMTGDLIRHLLLHHDEKDISSRTELFLFLADRSQHVQEIILPALASKKIVLCDRFNDSTLAYQGGARGFDIDWIRKLCHFATQGLEPDITLYLDIEPPEGLKRVKRSKDRIEKEDITFHQKIRDAYLSIAKKEPKSFMFWMDPKQPTKSSATPCDFSHLIGNAQAKETLSHLVLNKAVPQVLLFHGPRGIGKGLFALRLAQAFLRGTRAQHPDLHILHPDPDSDQHPVATIRLLIQETSLPPFEAPCKVFIIHDVGKMLPTSSNALLKTLEEPPSDTQFILLTSELSTLLPTVISRCSKVPFYPISDEELTLFLLEKHPTCDAKKIALLSEGSVAEALSRLSYQKPILPLDELFSSQGYTEIHRILYPLPDDFSSLETDRLFEEILYHIREHEPLRLEEAIPLITEARTALFHHLKLKTVLERFFVRHQLKI